MEIGGGWFHRRSTVIKHAEKLNPYFKHVKLNEEIRQTTSFSDFSVEAGILLRQ
jgi:hypothetical protein